MKLQSHFNLSHLNTLGLRSEAELYVEIESKIDLETLLADKSLLKQTWNILGGGSNLVLPPKVQGLTLRVANLGKELASEDSNYWFVKSQAGENWHEFVQWTLAQGYGGLENLSLIPGTVGASPIQNIGAYGVEVKDSLWEVTAIDLRDGSQKVFSNSQCQFTYRDSYFKREGAGKYLIWDVTFRLPKQISLHLEYGDVKKAVERLGLKLAPQDVAQAVIDIRQSKLPDPKVIGNAGSFFKNPIVSQQQREDLLKKYPDLVSFPYQTMEFKLAAGWLIDRAGWKGRKLGPVGMFEKQALVLVNHGGANADDVWKLAQQVRQDVKDLFQVDIEPEPIRWT